MSHLASALLTSQMLDLMTPKTSWADDVDELELPKSQEFVDEDGIRTTIEYTLNDEGKKVKVWLQDSPSFLNDDLMWTDYPSYQENATKICRRSCCCRKTKMGKVWTGERQ